MLDRHRARLQMCSVRACKASTVCEWFSRNALAVVIFCFMDSIHSVSGSLNAAGPLNGSRWWNVP